MELRRRKRIGDPDHAVTQKRGLATFGTRVQACTTRVTFLCPVPLSVLLYPSRNRISLGGRDREVRRISLGLHRIGQQSVHWQGYWGKMYVH